MKWIMLALALLNAAAQADPLIADGSQETTTNYTVELRGPLDRTNRVALELTLFDADIAGEATLSINGNMLQLIDGSIGAANDVSRVFLYATDPAWWTPGINRLVFGWPRDVLNNRPVGSSYRVDRVRVAYDVAPTECRWAWRPVAGPFAIAGRLIHSCQPGASVATESSFTITRGLVWLRAMAGGQPIASQTATAPIINDPADIAALWPQ